MDGRLGLVFSIALFTACGWVGKKIGNKLAKKYPLHKGMYD